MSFFDNKLSKVDLPFSDLVLYSLFINSLLFTSLPPFK
jgi:hypothetical protein